MKSFLFAAALVASQLAAAGVRYSNQVALPSSTTQVTLVDAQYDVVPTETVVRPIPGCRPDGEASNVCEETVVVASEAVIRANISFRDRSSSYEGHEASWTSVVFKLSDFSAEDVAMLKAAYPAWKHPLSKAPRQFAASKLSLTSQSVKQVIKVLDMKNSKICRVIGESGEQDPNCVEHLVYKDSWTTVTLVTVSRK